MGKAKEEEPYFLRLTQLDTKFELDKTAILGEIALKVMNAGIKYVRVCEPHPDDRMDSKSRPCGSAERCTVENEMLMLAM